MAAVDHLFTVMQRVRRPLTLTWAGLIAERLVRAFWPLWTVVSLVAAALFLGLHDALPVEAVWISLVLSGLAALTFLISGALKFRWPKRQETVDRLDSVMPGRPLAALADAQAIGRGDPASEALWRAHMVRMADRASSAQAVEPDLRLSRRDPFGLRYVALLGLVVALMFGSVLRVGSVTQLGPVAGAELTTGPSWEGWIEPPLYTRLPSLYLNYQEGEIRVPQGSRITLRLYGEVGALSVAETVSGRTEDVGAATDPEHAFDVAGDGTLAIDGPGGQSWTVVATQDAAPVVELIPDGLETTFDGQIQPALQGHG